MSFPKLTAVKKIAVLRANAIGDFVVTLPAIQALRETYPDAEIVLLGKPWHEEFLKAGRSAVDRVIVVPVKKGIRDEHHQREDQQAQKDFFYQMQQEHFDVAISLQGDGMAANPFIKKLGAKLTIGTSTPQTEKLDRSIPYYYYQSEVLRFLEVVRLIGATTNHPEPRLNILEEDRTEIKDVTDHLHGQPYVILNPCVTDSRRMWPIENYKTLIPLLSKRNLEIVITGSEADYAAVDVLISNTNASAINCCGLSIGGLAALASGAQMMIAPDTGPLHIAQAVQCPSVGLYWAPNVINWGPINREIHRPVISWIMECPYCGVTPNIPYPFEPNTILCRHEVSFIRNITADDVMAMADSLLDNTARHLSKVKIPAQL